MPRIRTRYPCRFSKLPKRLHEHVLEKQWDIMVDHDWWDFHYNDAENIGLKITGFDDYTITGELTICVEESVKLILKDHGETCDTYQLAKEYKIKLQVERVTQRCLGEEFWRDESEEIQESYKRALLKLYKKMLDDEYEYLTDSKTVLEWLKESDYKFDHEGEMT